MANEASPNCRVTPSLLPHWAREPKMKGSHFSKRVLIASITVLGIQQSTAHYRNKCRGGLEVLIHAQYEEMFLLKENENIPSYSSK